MKNAMRLSVVVMLLTLVSVSLPKSHQASVDGPGPFPSDCPVCPPPR